MAINRDELHRIVDSIPNHKLPRIAELLKSPYLEDEDLTLDEIKEVKEAQERIAKGDYVTLDELLQKYGEKDKDV